MIYVITYVKLQILKSQLKKKIDSYYFSCVVNNTDFTALE